MNNSEQLNTEEWVSNLQQNTEWKGGSAFDQYWITNQPTLEHFIKNLLSKAITNERANIARDTHWNIAEYFSNLDYLPEREELVTNLFSIINQINKD